VGGDAEKVDGEEEPIPIKFKTIEGKLVLFLIFTWSENTPSVLHIGTEGVVICSDW
jgi:hypothetical protein